ncbi:transcriptional regulator GlxA family with amidase domain [Beijerinckia sp. GAS462]|nr:transcriptional regulator GlxA family with amidase domain [Beijerinckia sp. GAS462]SEB67437.1 transcriptional regulator, AraC family with amidase-like domain [Beijerinckia sp. 28-YEA-48]
MPNAPRRIAILTFPDVQLLDVAGPLQAFASANDLAASGKRPLPYETMVLAQEQRVRTTAGLVLETMPLSARSAPFDTLMLAGGQGVNVASEDESLIRWIKSRARTTRRMASVCSGAFLLAAAGLLDGRRAVTHWRRCAEFARLYPEVKLDPDPIFVRDGNIWTSAGITAGIDLALALIEDDLGRETALAVARQLVVFLKRPGGQSQYSATLALQESDGRFDRLHAWIMENLRGDLSLPTLAAQAHMSARSFSRHYAHETGITPARAIEQIRVEAARRLLEERASVAQTSKRCGFGSEETMRRSFLRLLNVSPQAYRERF